MRARIPPGWCAAAWSDSVNAVFASTILDDAWRQSVLVTTALVVRSGLRPFWRDHSLYWAQSGHPPAFTRPSGRVRQFSPAVLSSRGDTLSDAESVLTRVPFPTKRTYRMVTSTCFQSCLRRASPPPPNTCGRHFRMSSVPATGSFRVSVPVLRRCVCSEGFHVRRHHLDRCNGVRRSRSKHGKMCAKADQFSSRCVQPSGPAAGNRSQSSVPILR
jgi:hypothetical protein